MAVTIRDVAKAAGVSVSTVSKVINGWSTISPATAARVQDAIRALDYTPNARAVSFARKATMNIVFLASLGKEEAYKNPHMFEIMCGVYGELAKHGYSMTLIDTRKEAVPGEMVSRIIATRSADGIVIHGSALSRENASLILAHQFPHIIIGNPGFSNQLCWIDTNHLLGGQFAAEHMLSCGYERTAFIGGRKTDVISQQRQKGVTGTFLKSGHRIPREHIVYTDSSREAAYSATKELLTSENPPRAIICENNTIALGVARALEHMGKKVPEEVAFSTFDSYPYSAVIDPHPTVIDIDVYDMGVQAGNTIVRKLENPSLLVQQFTTLPILCKGKST